MAKRKRVSRITVVNKNEEGPKVEIASVWPTDWQGVYSVSLNLYDPDTKERTPIVAIKPEGKDPIVTSGKGVFLNLEVFEDLEAKEPYKG